MKQSTKLLSLVLALIMAFSFMTVIGNAALKKDEVTYSKVDDAALTPEQVADIALDLVDDLLADADIGFSLLGLELNLRSVDDAFSSLYGISKNFLFGLLKGALGDLANLSFSALYNSTTGATYNREADGELTMVYQLLQFLNDNKGVLQKAVNGIAKKEGVSLGLANGIVVGMVKDINVILTDLPNFLAEMVYDLLVYGSYGYDKDAEELGTLPADVDSIDEILQQAVAGLLVNPQDYEWKKDENGKDYKDWDMNSKLSPSFSALGIDAVKSNYANIPTKSIFGVIDTLAPFAINDLGIAALNNNLKKALMEAVEIDFNEVSYEELPQNVKTTFDAKENYVTYISYDCMAKATVDGEDEWYYTTKKSEVVKDADGIPVTDKDGNEVTEKVYKYYKANMESANEFAQYINWDWEIKKDPDPLAAGDGSDIACIDYNKIIADYTSITEALNHIVYIVYTCALKDDIKNEFVATTGAGWKDGKTSEKISDNIERLLKFLLSKFGDKIFGTDSEFAYYTYEELAPKSIIDIIALIGPSFFEDVMPQLVIPKDADGNYLFAESAAGSDTSAALLQFGALVLREFMTEITPELNYDSYIFGSTLTSANGRTFANHSPAEWFDIILNMGVDVGYTYLYQLTDFNESREAAGITEARWSTMLDKVIIWAANYVGEGSTSVLAGFDPDKISGIDGSLNKLSYVLNTLLPLGFVNGCTANGYDLDVATLLGKVESFVTTFDLSILASLFGRNEASSYNLLNTPNVIKQVLDLANRILALVLGNNLLPATSSVSAVLENANLQSVISTLLSSLNTRKVAIIRNLLPVLAIFIQDWGGEQQMGDPNIGIPQTITLTDGALTSEFSVKNGSIGVWRHYVDKNGESQQDEQYKYTITSVTAKAWKPQNVSNGLAESWVETSGVVTINNFSAFTLDFAQSQNVSYSVANVDANGAIAQFTVKYKVQGEDSTDPENPKYLLDDEFIVTKTVWLNYNRDINNDFVRNPARADSSHQDNGIYSPQFIGLDSAIEVIPTLTTAKLERNNDALTIGGSAQSFGLVSTGNDTVHGITWGDISGNKVHQDCTCAKETPEGFPEGSGYVPVQNFSTYTENRYWDKVKTGGSFFNPTYGPTTFDIKGSFNAAVWKSCVDDGTLYPGAKSEWSIDISDKNTGNATFTLVYYDDIYLSKLQSLVNDEVGHNRTEETYKTTGTSLADSLLVAADDLATADVFEKETNFTTKATNEAGDEVTSIDNATAWATYQKALKDGIKGAWQNWNNDSVFNHKALYEALAVAAADVEYLKKGSEDLVGVDTLDADVIKLEEYVDGVEATYSDRYDYTDYMMYRWNRYNDARNDAHDIINAYKATLRTEADLTKYFPYTNIYPSELDALVNGKTYSAYIMALLEDFDEDTIKENRVRLEDAKVHYSGYELLDVVQAKNMVGRTGERLITRGGVIKTHLNNEITSAYNMIGTDNSDETYSYRSWNKYIDAYNDAVAVNADPASSQMEVFDAKWELLTCRKELVKVEDEADYTELELLIDQARVALASANLYDNTNKEFGQVLAELGYEEDIDRDIFPMSAIYVNTEPYTWKDQEIIDEAATALKEALAKLKFKNVNVTATAGNNVTIGENVVIEEGDEENGIAPVTATIATIAAKQGADDVKALFNVTADNLNGFGADNITVTNDVNYSVYKTEIDEETGEEVELIELNGFAGTNSVVTFYTVQDGIKIPVATVKIIVEADINGDGVLDVLDAAYATLVVEDFAELNGCFFIAGNLDATTTDVEGNQTINADDYGAIVNKVKAAA